MVKCEYKGRPTMKFTITKPEKLIKALIHNVQGMSFGSAQKTIRLGKVKVNDKRTKDNIDLKNGDIIDIYEFNKTKPNIPIIYEDDNIIIVNKPQAIECATRDKSSDNTYSLEELLEDKSAIVVHRLDRLTEGIVVLARSKEVASKFEKIFRTREVNKFYKAYVYGKVQNTGIQKAYLKKNNRTSMVEISDKELPDYKEILTEITTITEHNNNSLLDIKLHTGRTHQIRAHLSHLGHSILGDTKYNTNDQKTNIYRNQYKGYFLTAYKIEFNISEPTLKYLNDLHIEIIPSWLELIKNS